MGVLSRESDPWPATFSVWLSAVEISDVEAALVEPVARLEVTQAPAAFLSSLAAKYDPSAIEVVVIANPPIVRPQSRNYDASPFRGGANINAPVGGCTDARPWIDSSNYYMITAGHCGPEGGSV